MKVGFPLHRVSCLISVAEQLPPVHVNATQVVESVANDGRFTSPNLQELVP